MRFADLLRRHPRYLGFGFAHYFFSFVGQTFFVSLFVAAMSGRLGWAEGTFATVYSGVTLVAAFVLPLIGQQLDHARVRYVSTAAALWLVAGLGLLATAGALPLVVLGLFMVRLGGQGVLPLIGSTTTGRYFTAGRGRALSAVILGISLAEVLLPPAAVFLLLRFGDQPVWAAAAGLVLLVFLPAVWLLVRRYDDFQRAGDVARAQEQERGEGEAPTAASWTRRQVLADRRFRLIVPVVVYIPFVFTGLVFNQSVLAELRGYSPQWMAWGLSAYGLSRVVSLLGAGGLVDRYGAEWALRRFLAPAALGLALLWLLPGRGSVPLFFGLSGLSAGMASVLLPALWAERYGPRFLGSIKSTVWLLIVLASAAAPVVWSYGLRLGLDVWLGLMVAYAAACLLLARTGRAAVP